MKKIICCLVFSFFSFILLFGNVNKDRIGDSQQAYRNALYCFDKAEYGQSLKYAEDAILFRKQQIDYEVETLKSSLSSRAVRSAGDNIKKIKEQLLERKEYNSINIIDYYLKKMGIDFFDNSITQLLDYMESLAVFPEVHKLIGDIYKLEGEYGVAEKYYKSALDNANVLDVPDEKYEILYLLAEISEFEKDYDEYELRLLSILSEDENFKNKSLKDAMIHTISGNNKKSVDKFFSLYRANSYMCLNAYIKLAEYYFSINELDRALSLSALAVITSFTKISESLESRNNEYKTTTLDLFLQECSFYDDIIEWGSKNMVWNSYTTFAKITIKKGYKEFAKELLKILAHYLPETYWQKDAVLILENLE